MDAFTASPYRGTQALVTPTFSPPSSRTRSKTASDLRTKSSKAQSSSTSLSTHSSLPSFSSYTFQTKATTITSARPKARDRPRSWRRGRSSTRVPQYSADRIKETNPRRVDLLWRQVMAPKVAPKRSAPAASAPASNTRASKLRKVQSSEDTTTSGVETASQPSTQRTKKSQGPKNALASDSNFETTQLIPRGIEIQKARDPGAGYLTGAYAYFSSKVPPDPAESREFYKGIVQEILAGRVERDVNDSIFLSVDDVFVRSVHTAYRVLGEARLPESEFNAYATQNLFIGQYSILENDATRRLSAVRSLQWSLAPNEFDQTVWHTPPLLSPDNPPPNPFDFDIHPDCQFWLSDKILNADYREAAGQLVHCKALGTFCPYFSIEFKANNESKRTVVNQVAAAGSISLFNRYQLKLHASPDSNPEDSELVRHFGLTMEKEDWAVWHFKPKTADGTWTGCKATFLDSGTCRTEQGVRRLLPWINEIHRWGLCEYALGCEDDIKLILTAGPGRNWGTSIISHRVVEVQSRAVAENMQEMLPGPEYFRIRDPRKHRS